MKTIVLGAGASVHAGYPLASNLGQRLLTWVRSHTQGVPYRTSLELISSKYGDAFDFEHALSDLMIQREKRLELAADAPYILDHVQEAIRQYFMSIRSSKIFLYQELVRRLEPRDVIISFNYDLAMDRALSLSGLWNLNDGYGFKLMNDLEARTDVKLLKLHGSSNWRALLFGGTTGSFVVREGLSMGSRPVLPFHPDMEYVGAAGFVDPGAPNGPAASIGMMILPANPKRFYFETSFGVELSAFWDDLWEQARLAIAASDQIAVIGYSLPMIDEQARHLLLNHHNKDCDLSVACKADTGRITEEFRRSGFSQVSETCSFEEYLLRE